LNNVGIIYQIIYLTNIILAGAELVEYHQKYLLNKLVNEKWKNQ